MSLHKVNFEVDVLVDSQCKEDAVNIAIKNFHNEIRFNTARDFYVNVYTIQRSEDIPSRWMDSTPYCGDKICQDYNLGE